MGIKDEELEGLSDEERAALEDNDDDSEILSNIAGAADDEDQDEDDGGDGQGDDPAGDDDAAADAGAADAADANADGADGGESDAGDKASGDAEEDSSKQDGFVPQFDASAPEGISEQIAALDEQELALEAKFANGEIDTHELSRAMREISSKRTELVIDQKQAEWAAKQNVEFEQQFNKRITKQFFERPAAKLYEDEIMYSVLDRTVAALRAKDPAKGYEWALNEADRQVRKRFNTGTEPANEVKQQKREPDLSKVPKTLAQLPAAEMAETGNEEFAHLDKLDGIALEQALRKLTPEQEARYLGAAA